MQVDGINTQNRFITDILYYYTDQNILTHEMEDDNYYIGYGGSIDLEFFAKKNNFYFFSGIYNIAGFIDWRSVSKLTYAFDSNTKYIGDDGYYHYKPFGVGQYTIDTNFHQKLPLYIKYKLHYNIDNFTIGDNATCSKNLKYDELFLKYYYFKIGFIPQNKNFIYGIDTNYIKLEISNNLKYHSKYIKVFLDISF
jgi:hypothetical protein